MQLVEIAKALSLRSKVLLLDEPTASLTPHETDSLFRLLRKLRDDGVGMLFVSHKLEEVQAICDAVTVLRDGRNACESRGMAGLGRQDLVRLMIGRAEQIPDWRTRDHGGAPPVLELDKLATSLGHRDITLRVRRGEIVGLYGLVGAGRTELAKSIIGLHPVTAGTMRIAGEPAEHRRRRRGGPPPPHRLRERGPERGGAGPHPFGARERRHSALASLAGATGFLIDRRIQTETEPFIRKLEVRTPSLHQIVGNLSGGNQQKISVAKWLAAGVQLLIIDEPSVGIDIKTKAYLHGLIRDLSDSGTAILLITSDMPEMITLADRIAVMSDYRIRGEIVNNRDYDAMSESIMGLIHRVDAA